MPRRTDGLYQRRGYHYFKYKSADGTWHEHATRTRNYDEARSIRARFKSDVEKGRIPNERADWMLRQAIERHLAERKCRIAASSYASEASITRTLLRELKPGTRLQKLANIDAIRDYETTRLSAGYPKHQNRSYEKTSHGHNLINTSTG